MHNSRQKRRRWQLKKFKRRTKTLWLRKIEAVQFLKNSLNDTNSMNMALNTVSNLYIKISKFLLEVKVIITN